MLRSRCQESCKCSTNPSVGHLKISPSLVKGPKSCSIFEQLFRRTSGSKMLQHVSSRCSIPSKVAKAVLVMKVATTMGILPCAACSHVFSVAASKSPISCKSPCQLISRSYRRVYIRTCSSLQSSKASPKRSSASIGGAGCGEGCLGCTQFVGTSHGQSCGSSFEGQS